MKNAIIIKSVLEIRNDMPRIGTRKLHFMLTETLQLHAIDIGRDSLFDLLADYSMLVRKRKKRKTITTDSNHPFRKYPNMIKELTIMLLFFTKVDTVRRWTHSIQAMAL